MKCCIDVGIDMEREVAVIHHASAGKREDRDKNQLKMRIYKAMEGMTLRE